jgi:predicted PurR-regulated permease PerM
MAAGAAGAFAGDADGAEARRVAMSLPSLSMPPPLVAFDSRLGNSRVWRRQGNGHAIIARAMASTPIAIDPATRRSATNWVGRGLLFVATVFLLEHARPLLLPIAIAIVFTFVLAAPVRALQRAGIHEYIGSALVIAAVLGIAVVLLMLVAAPAAAWWARAPLIVHDLVEALQGWRDALFPYAPPASLARAPSAPPPVDPLGEQLASEGWTFTRLAIGQTISFALSAAATVILLYFLLASERWLVMRTVAVVRRPRSRALILSGVRQAQRDIGLFISTMSLVNVALGVATGLALWAIGLPNPVLWGTTTAVLAFIPYLGPLMITLLLLLAGSVAFGTGVEMLGPPAAFLLLHGIEANFLSPMIMGHRLSLRPVFVFLAVMVWGWLWGIAGAFLAVPLLLGLRAFCKRIRSLRLVCVYLEGD